jgi:hypothetical protein
MRRVTRISAYHWYLASPYWKVRRREALKRANQIRRNGTAAVEKDLRERS